MRIEKAIAKYPYVAYNPAEHVFVGFFDINNMIEYYETLYKSKHWVNGVRFFENGKEIKL